MGWSRTAMGREVVGILENPLPYMLLYEENTVVWGRENLNKTMGVHVLLQSIPRILMSYISVSKTIFPLPGTFTDKITRAIRIGITIVLMLFPES